ncbi:MAG: hypothetical protein IPG66_05825 [Hydrogenophilales bacterium]|nr:hypothetical protein [Hydrogenophilales bacterium]
MASFDQVYTHKGWFGICPVWLADIDTDCPAVWPRYGLQFLLGASELLYGGMIWLLTAMNPDAEPLFPIVITGELRRPKVIRHD